MTWRVMSQWDTQKMWKYNIYITYHFAVTFLVLFGVFRQNTFEKHEKSGQIHPFGNSNQFWTFGFVSITFGLLLSNFGFFVKTRISSVLKTQFKNRTTAYRIKPIVGIKNLKNTTKMSQKAQNRFRK